MERADSPSVKRRESSISSQIVVLLLSFTIFPMVALTALLYWVNTASYREEIVRNQKAIAGRLSDMVTSRIQGRLNSLDLLSLSQRLRSSEQPYIHRIFGNFIDKQPEIDAIALSTPDGYPIVQYSRLNAYREDTYEWFGKEPGFDTASLGTTSLGKVRASHFGPFPTLPLYVPILDDAREVRAVLCADLNISRMWRMLSQTYLGENLTAYIVDKNGTLIASDDPSMVFEGKNLKEIPIVHQFLEDHQGVFEYRGLKGADVVGVIEKASLTDWGIVVETSKKSAFKRLRWLWRTFAIVSLAMSLIAGALGWAFSLWKILRPIRELQKDVRVIATGDLDRRIQLKRSDELGMLAKDLSIMVENLKSLTVSREELARENIERQKSESALREKERRLSDILDFFPNPTLAIDEDRRIIIWNKAIEEMTGIASEEMLGQGDYAYTVPFYGDKRSQLMDLIWEEKPTVMKKYSSIRKEGNSFVAEAYCPALYGGKGAWILAKASPLHDPRGRIIGAIESIRDITEYKRTQEALERRIIALTQPLDSVSTIEFEELFDLAQIQKLQDQFAQAAGIASIITRPDGVPITRGSNFCRLCNEIIRRTSKGLKHCYQSDAILGRHHPEGPIIQTCLSSGLWDAGASITVGGKHIANWLIGQVRNESQDEERMRAYAREIGADEAVFMEAVREVPSMGKEQFEKIAQSLFTLAGQLSNMAFQNIQQARFISQAKEAEKEKQRLQDQLVQAQKLESVGRLAGGVAHDFNNMLQVILGYIELCLDAPKSGEKLKENLLQIQKAAMRSTDLVQQLLAFARKQIISPKVLDLNDVITNSIAMWRRLIQENIDLAWIPGHDLRHVRIDPSQVNQVLTNLVINARDAMGGGTGSITIETHNRVLDEDFCKENPGMRPGEVVTLTVEDTGCGMDLETLQHLYEPFFTTKGLAGGTGLGLSTVYGIVEQNHGLITVSSAPGKGTRFQIHLPVETDTEAWELETAPVGIKQKGNETLLIVEDDPSILNLTQTILTDLGYEVLTAEKPESALSMAQSYKGRIDLLVTDVVMPQMNGLELYTRLHDLLPHLKCLFMSGYTDDVIAHHGILEKGVHLLHKPFPMGELAASVREALKDHPPA
jgi:PAS domain S-box-containing protein